MKEIKICEADFNVADEYQAICQQAPKSGAIVFFVGLVRELYTESSESEILDYIELSHYAGMTESLCQSIIDQAHQRYSPEKIRVIHRVGKIYAAEQIVMVAVASKHRKQAFDAAQFMMDYLKTKATLWKKEVSASGECWIGLKDKDIAAAEKW